jgi:hypothetical protein
MVRALKAFFPAVLLAYVLASVLATQSNLGHLQMLGMEVGLADRADATFHDIIGMASSYLLLILVAFVLGLPVAAGLARLMPGQRALLYALAGFTAIVVLHLIMKAVLGISGIAATRTTAGLIGQGAAGAIGGLCFHWLSRSRQDVL